MSLFRSVNGQVSSKRVMGITYLCSSLILFLYKELQNLQITNPEIFIGMVVTGGTLIGIALAEHFKGFKEKQK